MTRIELKTSDQVLSVVTRPTIASGDQNTVGIKVLFDSAWDGYEKNATFSTAIAPDVYEVILDDDACVIPHEVLTTPGTLYIGIRGIKANDGKVKTSTLVSYRIKEGAPIGTATAKPPTPDVYQQLLEKLAQIEANPGNDGASAYEIWLKQGNVGTEADFLESLHGKDGKDGYTPRKGVDYFDGVDGADGKDGYTPQKGVDYFDGKDGKDGANGKDGKDYVLNEADKTEIAGQAAEMVSETFTSEVWTFELEDGSVVEKKVVLA